MIPKAAISRIRHSSEAYHSCLNSKLYVFQPALVGISTPESKYAVARVIDHEGWAIPADDYDSACRIMDELVRDEAASSQGRAYKHNEGRIA